jgi:hypothetical protein
MQEAVSTRTPAHLWIVGILALLWNGMGCFDYVMTRMRNTEYLASAMPSVDPNAMLAWIDNFPIYAQIGWGLGVWMGLLGSILLLLRNRWAVWSYGLSLLGAILGLGYQIALAPPLAGADRTIDKAMPFVIIIVALALFLYARAMEKRAVLR